MQMNNRRSDKGQLFQWINMVSFAMNDVLLYLDSHPCDKEALAYFHQVKSLREKALQEYASAYGPLTLDTVSWTDDKWKWTLEPWPWEGGC